MRTYAVTLFALLALAGILSTPVSAQPFFPENHYAVYRLVEPVSIDAELLLRDQFGEYLYHVAHLDKLGNPARKNNEPMFDPFLHQTWWRIDPDVTGPVRTVYFNNQFGGQRWTVKQPSYLVLPADKQDYPGAPPGNPPHWNHYLCYDAEGPMIDLTVTITDQFGTLTTMLLRPLYFCNPTDKTHDGRPYPIVEPFPHLACYLVEPLLVGRQVSTTDQFHHGPNIAEELCWFCVPSDKQQVIPTSETTWGQIKALYSD